MKKKLVLLCCLIFAAASLSSCAYMAVMGVDLPQSGASAAGLSNNPGAGPQNGIPAGSGDTVTITRAEYDRLMKLENVLDAMDIAEMYYYEEVDEQKMIDGAAAGALAGIGDPYTYYYTAEEYAALWEDDEGEYAGVGIQITTSYVTGLCTISRVFAGSPAEKAGVLRNDILYKVDDLYVNSETIDEAVSIMRGTPGTKVTVTFLRNGEEIAFELERAQITVNRVSSMMLADNVGYIYLYEFAGDCDKEFAKAVDKLEGEGAKGLIIDLRDNPGGWVNAAESICDIFLDKGIVCTLRYKDGSEETYNTEDGRKDMALVVLVNENSASSSEILTGCLKDRAGAMVVGKKSYGKGIVQSVIPLANGTGMQVTVAEYVTPNGTKIHKNGIVPDVDIGLEEGDNGMYEFGDLKDPQLAKALEVIQNKLAK